eukprot:scaffold1910_cov87-Cylindrotheca_fusiformis.AAC.1
MMALEETFDVFSEAIRKPMYIPESVVIEEHRNLQFWKRQEVPYGIDMVKAPEAWETYSQINQGAGVKVCVMDTGLDQDHEDFIRSNLSGYTGREAFTPWNQDREGHGTHVSGTIAAADNDEGVVGVAPLAEIYMVRVFDNEGKFYGSDVVAAAEACRDAGAKIISMSLGGPSYDSDEKRAFDDLFDEGILAIAAAGNDGTDDYSFPASYERVMSVAAVNSNRNHAAFSQFNDRVDIAAPGVNVRSTWNNGRYSSISGTSMATPHVSGVAALMLAFKPDATPTELKTAMLNTAENPNKPNGGRNNQYGYGIVNAQKAIEWLASDNNNSGGNGNGGGNGGNDNDVKCGANELDFQLNIRTDDYGYETSWVLVDLQSNSAIKTVGEGTYGNNVDTTAQECLSANKCYSVTIYDSYGDGISSSGQGNPGFQLLVNDQVIQNNKSFGSSITLPRFGNCSGQGPAPTNPPNNNNPTNPPTFAPVPPPTPSPVPPPTSPPEDDEKECCFFFFCWSC